METHGAVAVEKVSVLEDVGSVEELKQDRGQEEGIKASGAPAGARQLQAVSGGGKLAQFHPAPTSKGLPSRKALWEVVEVATNDCRYTRHSCPLVGPTQEAIVLGGGIRQAARNAINHNDFNVQGLDADKALRDAAAGEELIRERMQRWAARNTGKGSHTLREASQHGLPGIFVITVCCGSAPHTTVPQTPETKCHDFLNPLIGGGLTSEKHIGSDLLNLPFLVKNGSRVDDSESDRRSSKRTWVEGLTKSVAQQPRNEKACAAVNPEPPKGPEDLETRTGPARTEGNMACGIDKENPGKNWRIVQMTSDEEGSISRKNVAP